MKKLVNLASAVVMCAVIVCSFALTAFAESTAYEINTLNMSISVPNDMVVLTRESKPNDAFFETFKLNYDTTMAQLKEGNIYLEAVTKDSALTLTVTMTKTEDSTKIGSYNSLSDEELSNIMKKLRENSAYKDASPVEYKDIKYICLNMSYKSGKKTVQAQQYNTVMNGENINITMQAAPGKKLTAANKEMLADIVGNTTILNDTFFTRNRALILYGSITLAAIIVVIVVLIILLKYFRNPDRKHKILVHELAHEHKITETTEIPRKHIYDVTQPTNTFMTKYRPVDEVGKRGKKKKKQVAAEEVRDIKSVSEPVPEQIEEKPIAPVEYANNTENDIVVPVDETDEDRIIREVRAEVAKADAQEKAEAVAIKTTAQPAPEVEAEVEAPAEEPEEAVEQPAFEAQPEQTEPEEIAPKRPVAAPKSDYEYDADEAVAEFEEIQQREDDFDEPADYFDNVPEEEEMYAYTDVETAVDDYTAAKRRSYYDGDEEEIIESVKDNTIWDTSKKVLLAIGSGLLIALKALGKGLVIVFKAIFKGLVYFFTHAKIFFVNLFKMIKHNRAMKKRRRAEEERRRQESERRRAQREAQRSRQRANANRGENDLIQVRSSTERRPRPSQSGQRRSGTYQPTRTAPRDRSASRDRYQSRERSASRDRYQSRDRRPRR